MTGILCDHSYECIYQGKCKFQTLNFWSRDCCLLDDTHCKYCVKCQVLSKKHTRKKY